MADEEFHEIQLNGKQMVFLFMAGTVAAVVIFLCGLMVGRNLRSPKLDAAAATEAVVGDPTRPADPLPPATAATEGGTPVTATETLTYASRLDAPTPVAETLGEAEDPTRPAAAPKPAATATPEKAQPEKPADTKTPADKKPTTPAVAPAAAAVAPAPSNEPAGNGWAVQVQAVTTRAEADALAKRLSSKGYPAFVTPSTATGTPSFYRVRVGKYTNKREADAVSVKLKKEEQFNPWVTR